MTRSLGLRILLFQWMAVIALTGLLLFFQTRSDTYYAVKDVGSITSTDEMLITWKWFWDGLTVPLAMLLSATFTGPSNSWAKGKADMLRWALAFFFSTAYLVFFAAPLFFFATETELSLVNTKLFQVNNTGMGLWQGIVIACVTAFILDGRE